MVSGKTDLLTIVVEDTTGNAVSGLASSRLQLQPRGRYAAPARSAPSPPTATPGTYTAVFTGTTAGTASTLTVTVSGVTLNTKPAVQVVAGADQWSEVH